MEKLKRHKHVSSSASPKSARRVSAKLKLEDFMQQGSRNQKLSRCERENRNGKMPSHSCEENTSVVCMNASTSSDLESSVSVLEAVESGTPNYLDESTREQVVPTHKLVTECDVLQRLAEIHSFCISGEYFFIVSFSQNWHTFEKRHA